MKAEIISIGTELLLGNIVDTNTPFLANRLAELGIDLYFTSSVGDNRQRLAGVFKLAWERSELILTTGGLGPTQGDITREVIAGFLGEKLEVDAVLQQSLVDYFARRGLEMPFNNLKQATLIPSARAILNPTGTAPGWWVEKGGHIIVAMPGPPIEMQYMWQNQVFPRLKEKTGSIILSRTIKTFGLSEAKVDEVLAPLIALANPTLASYAKPDGIHLRVTLKSTRKEEAQELFSRREAEIKAALGDCVWGYDEDTMGEVAGRLLSSQGVSLAVAECFSGGLLTTILTGTGESEKFFKGGLTPNTAGAKLDVGLNPSLAEGKDGAEVASAMASLVRRRFNSDIGLAIEGDSESSEASATAKIFVAIDTGKSPPAVQTYTGRLLQMKSRAAYFALFSLIKYLRG